MPSAKARFGGKGKLNTHWCLNTKQREEIGKLCPVDVEEDNTLTQLLDEDPLRLLRPAIEAEEERTGKRDVDEEERRRLVVEGYLGLTESSTEEERKILDEYKNQICRTRKDDFVDDIEHVSLWAYTELKELETRASKEDARAELEYLNKRLTELEKGFSTLSPNIRMMFPGDVNEHKDALVAMRKEVGNVLKKLEGMPRQKRKGVTRQWIAKELAVRVLRKAQQYGMKVSSSPDGKAVELLNAVGKALEKGEYEENTWKDIAAKAIRVVNRKTTPDGK